jgi:hypothetical protein
MVKLYLFSPIRLHGMVHNWLNVVILYYHRKHKQQQQQWLTAKKTLSLNGLQQSMHCCTVSSRYLATFFGASTDMHITTDILIKE